MVETWRGAGAVAVGSLDPPDHTRVRAALNAVFTPARIKAFAPVARTIATELLGHLVTKTEFDFISEFTVPYTLRVICRFLGVPDEFHERCGKWCDQRIELMMLHDQVDPDHLLERARGLRDYGEFARRLVAERLAAPGADVISELLTPAKAGAELTPREVAVQLPTLIFAGHVTAAQALGSTLYHQMSSPGGWPAVVDGTVAVPDLVEEGLRFDSALAGMYRTAVNDVVVGGVQVRAGARLLLIFGAANRDSSWHSCPHQFKPGRKPAAHLAFGRGAHFCLGAGLARSELNIAIQSLVNLLPTLTLAPEWIPTYRPVFPLRALTELRVRL
jgi:cytochrome P450